MSVDSVDIARRAVEALPQPLRDRAGLPELAQRLAFEVMEFGHGIVPGGPEDPQQTVLQTLCEDLESALLLEDLLATQQPEVEQLTPEQRAQQILAKAELVVNKLKTGASLQQLIRTELADTDCGACDHPTCDEYSIALAKGTDKDNTKCEPGGPKVTAQVELVMEIAHGETVEPTKIIAIADQAAAAPQREGGLKVLELGTGNGFPAITLSRLYTDVDFTVIEENVKRAWLLTRLINVLGARNCRVIIGNWRDSLDQLAGKFDVVLLKHVPPTEAVSRGVGFARPGGVVVDWQPRTWSKGAAQYQSYGPGYKLPLQAPRYFRSAPIAKRVLLMVRRPEEQAPAAGGRARGWGRHRRQGRGRGLSAAARAAREHSKVTRNVLIGGVLGLALGCAVGLAPGVDHGPWLWAPAMAAFGAVMGRLGGWVLRQSGDVAKMRTSVLLSGPVLVLLLCLAVDEPFAPPVLGSVLLGGALGWTTRVPSSRA